jgi:hypothetical protein
LDGLGTLFSNLVGGTRGFNLKVDLSRLHVSVLNHSLKTLLDTLVSNRFGVLISFFFCLKDEVNLAFLSNGVIGFFLFNYWFSLGNGSRLDWLWCRRSSWSGSLLSLFGKSCNRGGSFGFCGLLGSSLSLGLLWLGILVSLLLILLTLSCLSLLLLFWSSLLFLVCLLFFLLLLMGLFCFDLGGSVSFALFNSLLLLRDICFDLSDLLITVILSLLLNSFFLLLFLGFFLYLGR